MKPTASADQPLVLQGHSGYLIVPILFIPAVTLGAFAYFQDHLPEFCIQNAEKIIGIAAGVTLLLVIVALFQRTRRIEVSGNRLRYRSWLSDQTISPEQITAATFETELSGGGDQHMTEDYLTLWAAGDVELLRLSPQRWPREGLRALLIRLRATSVQMDRDVERYIKAQ